MSKVVANATYFQLTGLQKNLLDSIHKICIHGGQKVTPPITVNYLAEITQTSIGTVKNAITRLCEKGLLKKDKFKDGRGGWTKYRISDAAYSEIIQSESMSKVVAK